MSLRILYAGNLKAGENSLYRCETLKRLGQQITPFNLADYCFANRMLFWMMWHYPLAPLLRRLNHDLVQLAEQQRPDVVWLDKPIFITPKTVHRIHQLGARVVSFNPDNPFGPRKDGCWHQYMRIFRSVDLHVLLRHTDMERFTNWQLPFVALQLSFDPQHHTLPPDGWSDADRVRDISYIGSPYEQRPAFLQTLRDQYGLPLSISGPGWRRVLTADQYRRLISHGMLCDSEYRRVIWQSKINLSFVTHQNEDDTARKTFEIVGCGGFLLAERTPMHVACFEEGVEAEFFGCVEECAEKARFYLAHPQLRQAIAQRGYERAHRSGYDNDTLLRKVIDRLEQSPLSVSATPAELQSSQEPFVHS